MIYNFFDIGHCALEKNELALLCLFDIQYLIFYKIYIVKLIS